MTVVLADEKAPGTHATVEVCHSGWYCTFNRDTLVSSLIAIVLTIIVGLLVARRLRGGTPGKLQMGFELFLTYVRRLTNDTVAEEAREVVPLAATIGFYILVANWMDFFPLKDPVLPANADLNMTLAMALVVIIWVQSYSIRVLGLAGYLRRYTKPFEMKPVVRAVFVPLNIIEEVVKPITLSLRLFGNIFAGEVMIFLLTTKFPVWMSWFPVVVWKFFDVFFVGTIQAFIFMLLTVIYFGMAREGLEEEGHHQAGGHQRELARGPA